MRPMDDSDKLRRILKGCRTIAVVGLSAQWHRPSYLRRQVPAGARISRDPRESDVRDDPGREVLQAPRATSPTRWTWSIASARASEIPALADEAIAIGAKVLWMQLGVENAEARATRRGRGARGGRESLHEDRAWAVLRRPGLGGRQHQGDLGANASERAVPDNARRANGGRHGTVAHLGGGGLRPRDRGARHGDVLPPGDRRRRLRGRARRVARGRTSSCRPIVGGVVAVAGAWLVHLWHVAAAATSREGSNFLDRGQPVVLEGWANETANIARVKYRGSLVGRAPRACRGAARPGHHALHRRAGRQHARHRSDAAGALRRIATNDQSNRETHHVLEDHHRGHPHRSPSPRSRTAPALTDRHVHRRDVRRARRRGRAHRAAAERVGGRAPGQVLPRPRAGPEPHRPVLRPRRLHALAEGSAARRARAGLHHQGQHAALGGRHPLLPGDRSAARLLRLVRTTSRRSRSSRRRRCAREIGKMELDKTFESRDEINQHRGAACSTRPAAPGASRCCATRSRASRRRSRSCARCRRRSPPSARSAR